MYRYRYPQLRQNLVGAWCPSLGATGPILLDRSGRGNHGTLTNMDPGTDWVASGGGGRSGLALELDGSNDYIDLALRPIERHGSGPFTCCFWARSTVTKTHSPLGDNAGVATDKASIEFFDVSGVYWCRSNINNTQVTATGGTWPINQWVHVAAVYTGANLILYGNGIQVNSQSASGAVYNSIATLKAGRRGDYATTGGEVWYYSGQLDSINYFTRALSPAEIATLASYRGIEHGTIRVPVVRGATVSGGTGSLSATQAGNTLSAAGSLSIAGVLSTSQAGNTLSATGAVSIAGTVSTTQAGDTVSAAGTSGFTGSLSATQASNTVSSAGTLALSGTASLTQDGNTLSAAGTVASSGISGALTVTQAGNTVSSTGSISIAGVLSVSQAGNTVSAIGVSGDSALFATTVFGYYSTVEAW